MSSSFGWFVFHLFAAMFWLAVAVASGSWWFALGSVVSIAMLALIDLPSSSSDETDSADDDEEGGP